MNSLPNEQKITSEGLPAETREKRERCCAILREIGSVAIGVSGGVDSSLLLALAVETLGPENVLGVTATGLFHAAEETALARQIAGQFGVELVEMDIAALDDPNILSNPPDRCYHCKRYIFSQLQALATERKMGAIASGSNVDDQSDYRPGARAESELGVRRPLLEAGLGKAEIRALAHAMGVAVWDRPSKACLASRVPYGQPLLPEVLARIERGEAILVEMGFVACRLRDHDTLARIEVEVEDFPRAMALREQIITRLEALGYTYVTLDLKGLRTGAMNETLT